MARLLLPSLVGLSLVLAVAAGAAQRRAGDWETLGRREVDFRSDRDRIEVGRSEGRFRELRVAVKGAPLAMENMVVTFADGTTFRPNALHRFDEKTSSHVINLPGDRRTVRRVEFVYRSTTRREGKATVFLYAR
jgi:hypothetical protein